MTVRINKQPINLREKLSELDKPSGLTGEELLRSGTSSEARDALDLEEHLFEEFESTGIDDNATSTKVTVSDSGVVVDGTVTADGLTVDGSTSSIIQSDGVTTQLEIKSGLGGTTTGTSKIVMRALNAGSGTSYSVGEIATVSAAGGDTDMFLRTTTDSTGAQNRIKIDSDGDVSFYEDTGTTAKMVWNAGAERLGVGTSSPDAKLEIAHTDSAAYSSSSLQGGVGGVLINSGLNNNNNISQVTFRQRNNSAYDASIGASGGSGNFLFFKTNNAERMRLDSSGSLLVGTTIAEVYNGTTDGVALTNSGYIFAGKSGDAPMYLNRISNDGALISLGREGATVGSIGSSNTDLYIGSTDHGIKFHDASNAIMPWTPSSNTADSSGTLDLGTSLYKFKDLYLSGGVHLGGTGAANKLDDYEEGAWTPILSSAGNTGVTSVTSAVAKYTKVGQNVTLFFHLDFDGIVADVNDWLQIGGLPYAASVYGSTISPNNGTYSTNEYMLENRVSTGVVQVQESTTIMRLLTIFQGSGTLTGRDVISGTVTYQTHS